jgi:anti-sigma B factor antagonist
VRGIAWRHGGKGRFVSASTFRVETTSRSDERWLSVHGELDLYSAAELEREVGCALEASDTPLVVDLATTTFIDSSGLAALLRCAKAAALAHLALRVEAPPGHEARVLIDLSGTSGALGLRPA